MVGDAKGLDLTVRSYCEVHRHPYQMFTADWDTHGKAAGPIRNKEMLESGVDLLVAFPGGKGTNNCVQQAVVLSIPVLKVC